MNANNTAHYEPGIRRTVIEKSLNENREKQTGSYSDIRKNHNGLIYAKHDNGITNNLVVDKKDGKEHLLSGVAKFSIATEAKQNKREKSAVKKRSLKEP